MSEPRVDRFLANLDERRPCRDIYEDGCGTLVGPPKWDHRISRGLGGHHPTRQQALAAARSPNTLAPVLEALGEWDEEQYGDVRHAARSNPSHPGPAD